MMIADFVSSTNIFDTHPEEKMVAYEQGNSIILWNLISDKKVKMHSHDNDVKALCFSGVGGNLVASISGGIKCQLLVSEWQNLIRLHAVYLPSKHRKQPVSNVLLAFIEEKQTFVIIEVEKSTGYRLSTWQIKLDQLQIQFINELESSNQCFTLLSFNTKQVIQILTAEKNMIKFWTIDQNKAVLTNRISIKQDIQHTNINQLLNLVIVINDQGAIYLLNQQGDLVSQLKSDQVFTSSTCWESYLILGCLSGTLVIYEASTLNFVRSLHIHKPSTACSNNSSVHSLKTSSNGELIACKYNDGCFIVYDAYKNNTLGILIGQQGRINQVLWDQTNVIYSTSNDGSISQIIHRGDKFLQKITDTSTIYDKQLQRLQVNPKQHSKSIKCPKVKSICVDHLRDELYVGDSSGQLLVYSLPDIVFKKCISLAQQLGVSELRFSPAYQYLGVVFSSGFSILLDCENQLKPMLKLEDHLTPVNTRSNLYKSNIYRQQIIKGIRFYQNEFEMIKSDSINLKPSLNTKSPFASYPKLNQYYIPRQDKNFFTLTAYNSSSVRLHQIVKEGQILSSIAIHIYSIEGQISGFDLHPSKEYLFILSNLGYVAIYKLQTCELKAKIQVPPYSKYISIDPSGLYFAIANLHTIKEEDNIQLKYNQQTEQFERRQNQLSIVYEQAQIHTFFQSNSYKIRPCNIRIYESGTGLLCQEIHSIFNITTISFSVDGEFIICGGKQGKISVWSSTEEMIESISEVIQSMKVNPLFWKDYPIQIEEKVKDYVIKLQKNNNIQINEDTLDLSIIQAKGQTQHTQPKFSQQIVVPSQKQIVTQKSQYAKPSDPKINIENMQPYLKQNENQFSSLMQQLNQQKIEQSQGLQPLPEIISQEVIKQDIKQDIDNDLNNDIKNDQIEQ